MESPLRRVLRRLEEWRAREAPPPPRNMLAPEATAGLLALQLRYDRQLAGFYLEQLRGLDGEARRVLELGPGQTPGAALRMAAGGLEVAVVDRWLPTWHERWHGAYLRALLVESWPRSERLAACLVSKSFAPALTGAYRGGAESLGEIADGSFDAVVSNAVLEHVADLDSAARELWRVTRPGGLGAHQIDLRDHRDFSRPLEYLTLEEQEFRALFERSHGECGNRARGVDIVRAFAAAGFEVSPLDVLHKADLGYLAELVPRLARAWRERPPSELEGLGVILRVRRPVA